MLEKKVIRIKMAEAKVFEKGFQKLWFYQILCLISMFTLSAVMAIFNIQSQNAAMYSELILLIPCIIGYAVLNKKCGGVDLENDLGIRTVELVYIPYIVLMPIFYQIFCVYMTMPVSLGLNILFGSDMPEIDMPANTFGYISVILGLCVFAPFLEEFIYRGVMVRLMKGYSFQAVMLTTSLAFTMMHMDMSGFVQIFFLGMFLFLLRTATDSLLASMAAHSIINLMSFVSMMIAYEPDISEKVQTLVSTVEIGSLIVMPMLMFNFIRTTAANNGWILKQRLKGRKLGVSSALIIFTIIYAIWNLGILADNISSGYTKRAFDRIFSDDAVISEEELK